MKSTPRFLTVLFGAALLVAATSFGTTSAISGEQKSKKSDVHVKAPYTKVDVDDKIRVEAPYTKVKVGKRRVKVRAPYVNLDIKW